MKPELRTVLTEYEQALEAWSSHGSKIPEKSYGPEFIDWLADMRKLECLTSLAKAKWEMKYDAENAQNLIDDRHERTGLVKDAHQAIKSGVVANWAAVGVAIICVLVCFLILNEFRLIVLSATNPNTMVMQ